MKMVSTPHRASYLVVQKLIVDGSFRPTIPYLIGAMRVCTDTDEQICLPKPAGGSCVIFCLRSGTCLSILEFSFAQP
jgi:hypothetical protein